MSRSIHYFADADNSGLLRLLESERLVHASLYPGDGVWVGPKTLFASPSTYKLQEFILSCLPPGTWQLQGWGVVLGAGGRIERHDHQFPGNVWSGVYYLQTGGGAIEFDDGRYEPEGSSLIIFPADKMHSVTATKRRYSIAFNARQA